MDIIIYTGIVLFFYLISISFYHGKQYIQNWIKTIKLMKIKAVYWYLTQKISDK